jgi:cell division septum initiation protein DivIVA
MSGIVGYVAADTAMTALLERIAALETALMEAKSEASASMARAVLAEHRSAVPAVVVPEEDGHRKWWQRMGGTGGAYRGLGDRVEQLLRLAEEQADDVLASARAEAKGIRAAAVSDAERIRAAALDEASSGAK